MFDVILNYALSLHNFTWLWHIVLSVVAWFMLADILLGIILLMSINGHFSCRLCVWICLEFGGSFS